MEPEAVRIVERFFEVQGYREEGGTLVVYIDPGISDLNSTFKELYRGLSSSGYTPLLYSEEGLPTIRLIPVQKSSRRTLPLALSMITIVTVAATGYDLSYSFRQSSGYQTSLPSMAQDIVLFTALFMGALFLHEMGHWLVSRRAGVPVSLPYFIPAPPPRLGFIGTFGALISMKSLPPTLDELAYIGLAGPLSGFIAAIPITLLGIHLSSWIPASKMIEMMRAGKASSLGFAPLVFALMTSLMAPRGDYYMVMHPLAFAGFIVFFVTFLNLLPIGQLDGGHVLRSMTSMETHRRIGYLVVLLMIVFSKFMPVLLFFAIIALLLAGMGGGRHPGSMNVFSRPTRKAWIAFMVYMVLLVLTIPVPSH